VPQVSLLRLGSSSRFLLETPSLFVIRSKAKRRGGICSSRTSPENAEYDAQTIAISACPACRGRTRISATRAELPRVLFRKESSMKCANATKFHRKSRGSYPDFLAGQPGQGACALSSRKRGMMFVFPCTAIIFHPQVWANLDSGFARICGTSRSLRSFRSEGVCRVRPSHHPQLRRNSLGFRS